MTDLWIEKTYAAARVEGAVTWYTGLLLDDVALPMCRAFEQAYPGITATCDRSQPIDAVRKAITDRAAGQSVCDVFDGVGSPALAQAAGLDCAVDLPSGTEIPPNTRDAEGRWQAQILYHAPHAWNTDLVAADEAPVSFDDLLDPCWRGRMGWARTTLSGRPGFVALVLAKMGETRGRAYLTELKAQQIVPFDGLGRETMAALGRGDFAIALQVFAHHVLIERNAGGPVDWSPAAPILTFPNPINISRDAPHPAAARLFANFVLSAQGQAIMRAGHHIPARPDVQPLDPRLDRVSSHVLSPMEIARDADRWAAIGTEIFGP